MNGKFKTGDCVGHKNNVALIGHIVDRTSTEFPCRLNAIYKVIWVSSRLFYSYAWYAEDVICLHDYGDFLEKIKERLL